MFCDKKKIKEQMKMNKFEDLGILPIISDIPLNLEKSKIRKRFLQSLGGFKQGTFFRYCIIVGFTPKKTIKTSFLPLLSILIVKTHTLFFDRIQMFRKQFKKNMTFFVKQKKKSIFCETSTIFKIFENCQNLICCMTIVKINRIDVMDL